MIYLLSIIFTVLFVFYSKYQFQEVNGVSSGKWHPYGMLMRISVIITPFIMQFVQNDWKDYLLAGALNILLWEFLINKIALNTNLFYKGKIDNTLGKKKWLLYFAIFIIALLIRLFN